VLLPESSSVPPPDFERPVEPEITPDTVSVPLVAAMESARARELRVGRRELQGVAREREATFGEREAVETGVGREVVGVARPGRARKHERVAGDRGRAAPVGRGRSR